VDLIKTNIGGDAIKPVLERSAPVELFKTLPGAEHRLLRRVLCSEERSEHPIAMTGNRRPVNLKILDF
jgi:hypothetical protein